MRYVLQCEDSVEGIFSAVYEVWERHYEEKDISLRAMLSGETLNLELFTEYIPVSVKEEKAEKVIRTMKRNFPPELWEVLYRTACSCSQDKADVVYQLVRLALKQGSRVLDCLTNPYVVRGMELSRAVGNEQHHYLGFLRFMEVSRSLLLARYEPKNNITAMILPHFSDRLSGERLMIWDRNRNLAGISLPGKGQTLVYLTEEQSMLLSRLKEEQLPTEELWKTFVESISIRERENKKLQQTNLPLRYRKDMTEFQKKEERLNGLTEPLSDEMRPV